MNGFSLLLAFASLGAGAAYSWRTGVDQQQEFVLQIESEVVQALLSTPPPGELPETIYSPIPVEAGAIQRLCIAIVPKDGAPTKHTAAGEQRFRQLLMEAGRSASRTPMAIDGQVTILWPARAGTSPDQTFGVKTGWEPDTAGNQQYIVQIDPALLRTLAVGDELYVPVDPSAGRPARFAVKAGRDELPHVGGSQASQGASGRGRYPGLTDAGATNWGSAAATDPSRQNPRGGAGYGDLPSVDSRGTQYGAPPSYGNNGSTIPPMNSYGGYNSAQGGASGYDAYRSSLMTGAESGASNYPTQPAASQPPNLGVGQRAANRQYGETHVAALPPPPSAAATTAPLNPNVFTPSNPMQPQSQQNQPWGPLLFVTFALFFSIGGNLYLAYTALEFHSRYRSAIERLRSAARSA
jgi:hypothetical protein